MVYPHLPNEILGQICSLLPLEDVKHFREVSQKFADVGIRYLATEVHLAMTPWSFERVAKIAAHPVLHQHVQGLRVSYLRLRQESPTSLFKRAYETIKKLPCQFSSDDILQAQVEYCTYYHNVELLFSSGQFQDDIKETIAKFVNLRQVTLCDRRTKELEPYYKTEFLARGWLNPLSSKDDEEDDDGDDGKDDKEDDEKHDEEDDREDAKKDDEEDDEEDYEEDDEEDHEEDDDEDDEEEDRNEQDYKPQILLGILQGVQKVLEPRSEQLFELSCRLNNLDLITSNFPDWQQNMQCVTSLHLAIDDSDTLDKHTLREFLETAANLEELCIGPGFYCRPDLRTVDILPSVGAWPRLKSLRPDQVNLGVEEMVDFFKEHKRTLECLKLRDFFFKPRMENNWLEILREAHACGLHLKSCKLVGMYSWTHEGDEEALKWTKVWPKDILPDRALRYLMCGQKTNNKGREDAIYKHPYDWENLTWDDVEDFASAVENQMEFLREKLGNGS